ncbi:MULTISPECIES: helix-turn-helix domain-containing protein [Aerococcus]|uniref:XRE family transcriptional regulator n=2 Tax=Aerococcus TaxID=1375 RepID=A0A2I1L5W3_9LACT|nr:MULTISPECIES: helix-turn-helix transcriptional regulator [Aerococcus]KAA9218641.1 helix-turn-helix transcriptional regulator [Aerococcus loyolae]MCY3025903.1 helix-turn-helix domain-containing protein [Aerococcus loyolae]MCY3027754.1 helix-turn-helix domain-containing protein [Aerococcus loyolae]MCY3029659.1 helix-turn-helix domain-containing protein [Aerococcus loyolae]MDK6232470.1 helix-turn-helix transcriptional regulator [Aerococcus urinae]
MEIDKKQLGNRIKEIRVNLKLTLAQFADEIRNKTDGISKTGKSNVSKWERGENVPNGITLKAIAELGGMSVDELLHGASGYVEYNNNKITLFNIITNQISVMNSMIKKIDSNTNLALELKDLVKNYEYYIYLIKNPEYKFYIYRDRVYLMAEITELVASDYSLDIKTYDQIHVSKLNAKNLKMENLLNEKIRSKTQIIGIIKKYFDNNTEIYFSYSDKNNFESEKSTQILVNNNIEHENDFRTL